MFRQNAEVLNVKACGMWLSFLFKALDSLKQFIMQKIPHNTAYRSTTSTLQKTKNSTIKFISL